VNRPLGSISGSGFNYTVELYNNGIKFGGSGNISHLTATLSGPNVIQEPSIDQPTVDGLCYIYEYDHRNRLVEKKIPGKDWEHIVYDILDRPVLTQDGNQRIAANGVAANWMFSKYDKLGRVTYTGLFTSPLSRKQIQQQLDAQSASDLFEIRTTGGFTNGNKTIRYTNNNYPSDVTKMSVLSISYYDDDIRNTGANQEYDTNVVVSNNLEYSDEYSPVLSTSNIGLPTINEIRVLGTNDWITSASYYDEKGRAIFGAVENTHLGTWDKSWSQMDFIGKVSETKTQHFKQSLAQTISTYDYLTYDHMDRLLTHEQKIGSQAIERIVSNSYDAMGQLESKGVGGKATATQSLQNVDYTYNVRGWLTHINDQTSLGNDLFGFEINYNAPVLGAGSDALYNGNISETLWKTANDGVTRGYQYGYDALNRIKHATYRGGAVHQGSGMLENYSINDVNYDKNGNITTLNRFGLFESAQNNQTMDYVDKLIYQYSPKSNQLIDVVDNADDSSTNTFNGGFKDKYAGNNYIYGDANGNMTKDNNKDINSISYNHLNLPTSVTFADDRSIRYTYDAAGVKLKKEIFLSLPDLFNPVANTTTYYAGNYIYEKDGSGESLKFFSHPEGYIEKNGSNYDYVYQYKDHLGNVRLSYADTDNNGSVTSSEIKEENNYYPFGLKHKGYNNLMASGQRDHKYGFGGKEEQNELGLEWMDFHARNYDASLGRWMNIDPLAENFSTFSPYNYALNNPLYFIDPDGKEVINYDKILLGLQQAYQLLNDNAIKKYQKQSEDDKASDQAKSYALRGLKFHKDKVAKISEEIEDLKAKSVTTESRIKEYKNSHSESYKAIDQLTDSNHKDVDIYLSTSYEYGFNGYSTFGDIEESEGKYRINNSASKGKINSSSFIVTINTYFARDDDGNIPTYLEVMSHEFGHAYYIAKHLKEYREFIITSRAKGHKIDGHSYNAPGEDYAQYWQNHGKPKF
jgi:RHS repeat-associated protein